MVFAARPAWRRSIADGGARGRGHRPSLAARPARGDRARHARVGHMDRAGTGARPRGRGRHGGERRRRADARHRLSDAHRGVRRGHGDLGLAQSVRGQRHQGVLGRRREAHRGLRSGGRAHRGRHLLVGAGRGGAGDRAAGPGGALPRAPRAHPGRCRAAAGRADRDRLRQRRDRGAGAAVLRGARLRRDRDWRVAQRPQHQPRLRVDAPGGPAPRRSSPAARAWASRSTATATARCSSIIGARSSTATRSC